MFKRAPRGISLIETIIYIGLLAIILPAVVLSLIRVTREITVLDARNRLHTTSSLFASELNNDITSALSIKVSQSIFGTSPGSLVLVDADGQTVTIDRPTVTVSLPGGNQTIHRIRVTKGTTSFFVTDPDTDVASWQIDAVRNSGGTLTGLRWHLDLTNAQYVSTDPFQNARFVSDATLDLQPQTTEQ